MEPIILAELGKRLSCAENDINLKLYRLWAPHLYSEYWAEFLSKDVGAKSYYKAMVAKLAQKNISDKQANLLAFTATYANYGVDWEEPTDWALFKSDCLSLEYKGTHEQKAIRIWKLNELLLYILALHTGKQDKIKLHYERLVSPCCERDILRVMIPCDSTTLCTLPLLKCGEFAISESIAVSTNGLVVKVHDKMYYSYGRYADGEWASGKGYLTDSMKWVINSLELNDKFNVHALLEEVQEATNKGGSYGRIK